MSGARARRGRPPKYETKEAARAAANAASRKSRQQRKKKGTEQQQGSNGGLQIEFDLHSILQQAGVEGDAQITALDRGI
jgi:hypothetical protein